jgi:hypothetical protein
MSEPFPWKGRDGTKGAPMGPPLRAEAAKGAYFAAKFGLHRRIVKWRARDRGFLTRKGRVVWRGALSLPDGNPRRIGGKRVAVRVVIAVESRDRLKLTRMPGIYRADRRYRVTRVYT